MTESVVYSQPAYILHQQNYRESSLIIDALTQDFGRISLIAKGVRKAKSKSAGLLRPFLYLSLSFVGKGDLKTLTNVEMIGLSNELKGLSFYCGFYVNELLRNFLHKDDPHPEIFQEYHDCLSRLAQGFQIEAALRAFELNLIDSIGYGIKLDYDLWHEKPIDAEKTYLFKLGNGMVEDCRGQFSGAALLAMRQRKLDDLRVLREAKILMRIVIDSHLQGRQLKSRAVINDIIKHL
jgi:DNA repair protein RecO (recombination protein O)